MPPVPPDQCSPFPSRKRRSPPPPAPSQDVDIERDDDASADDGDNNQHDEDARNALPSSSRRPLTPSRGDRASTVHQRHGDRGSTDAAPARLLPVYVRFRDLEAAGIIANWTTLLRLIDDEGFPAGVLIGPNTRAWRLDTITEWLEARPTARKDIASNAIHPRVRDKRRADVAQETRS